MNLKPKRQGLTDDNITATVLFIPQVVAANGNGRSYRGFAQKLPFRTYCAIDIAVFRIKAGACHFKAQGQGHIAMKDLSILVMS